MIGKNRSALNWFFEFGDRIEECGTGSYTEDELKQLGFDQKSSGTWTLSRSYENGTTLGVALGKSTEGIISPFAACAKIELHGSEVARIDWNETKPRNRDKCVHGHLNNSGRHWYFADWKEFKNRLGSIWHSVLDSD